MLSSAARKPVTLTDTQQLTLRAGKLVTRKVWLPKFLYDALPWFYLAAGATAFLATVYISEWFWVLPHYLLFSAACIHLGAIVLRRRRIRSETSTADDDDQQP